MKPMLIGMTTILIGFGTFMACYTGAILVWVGFNVSAGFIMFIIYLALTSDVF